MELNHVILLITFQRKGGGVLSATSASSLPRDRKQVAYLKARVKQSECTNIDLTAKRDPILALTVKCKEEEESGNPYIRRVVTSPEPSVVLASDHQLSDIAKFCTDDTEFSILQVDPTYNLVSSVSPQRNMIICFY